MAMNKTQFEVLTDRLAARVEGAVVAPAASMLTDNAEAGLAWYVDESSDDPLFQAALLDPAARIDRLALAPNLRAYLDPLVGMTAWQGVIRAMSEYVQGEAGGSHASLGAWIADTGALVHPLAAEIIRKVLGESAFGTADAIVGAMHPPMMPCAFDRVFKGAMGTLTDITDNMATVAALSQETVFAADGDILALGSRHRFGSALLELDGLSSADVDLTAHYWNGADWVALDLTDPTTGLTINAGIISWDIPADWVPTRNDMDDPPNVFSDDAEEELYYILLQRNEATVVTPPDILWLQHLPEAITHADGNLYGIAQPPLAVVTITDANECVVTPVQSAGYNRFGPPGVANNVLKLLAVTTIGENVTFTLGYTNQAGAAGTKAQTAWTATINPGDTKNLALDTDDTGIRSVDPDTCAITTAATTGVFLVVASGYARAINPK